MFNSLERLLHLIGFEDWPLLLNVLKGDLSIIGPKPEKREIIAHYSEDEKKILKVRPGIFGPYQLLDLNGYSERKSDISADLSQEEVYRQHVLPKKLALELRFVQNRRVGKELRLFLDVLRLKALRLVNEKLMGEAQTRNFFLPVDVFLIALSYFLAYQLRFDWAVPSNEYITFLIALPIVIAFRISFFYLGGVYRNLWKYMSVRDLVSIISANTLSMIMIVVTVFFVGSVQHARSVFLIDWLLSIFLVGGSRLLLRLFNENTTVEGSFKRNVLIFGADDVGATLLKMLKNGRNDYNVVGFVDDEDIMQGTSIYGVRVLGASDSIPRLVQIFRVDEVFITGARLSAERMKSVLRYCKQAQVRHKVVPAVSDLLSGHVHLSKGRDVEISDLFGRQPVKLDLSAIQGFLRGKKVLVTGSGGSIGSELCRQIADYQPECLILVDKNENYLFEIQCELTAQFPAMTIYCNLCNVTNRDKLRKLFDLHKPDMVFHAAAHKHVPLSEDNPEEAVWNNILGSKAVADLAHEFRVDEFVMVSTDKAVNPTSIMGVTKRVAELYVQGLSKRSATRFVTVRFGNVLNSNGSVIPIFQRQISKGGPITITHPNVERYFMSISEAVQLILQAVTMGRNGEVFVLEMGKSIAIVDVATELILQAGLKPHEDIEIKFTGLRPGEKLFEELVGKNEELLPTSHTSIKTLKINEMIGKEEIDDGIKNLIRICRLEDFDSLLDCLKTLVPEFSPPSQANGHHEHLTNGVRPVTKRKSLPAHDVEPAMSE